MAAFEMCTLNPDLCYSAVIERLLDETCFWGREALIKLINLGAAPLRYVYNHNTNNNVQMSVDLL